MNRRSNAEHMTGREIPVTKHYPWSDMQPGDWFIARAQAVAIASNQNKRSGNTYAAVTKNGQNIVVRIK